MGLPITLGRNFRKGRKVYDTHTAPHTWRSPLWSQTHTYTHTFNRLHYQSQRGDGQERILMIVFLFCFGHQSQIQQVDAIQKMYKIDVRALVKTLYSQVSFAVQRMKWKSFTSPKDVYAVSARTLGLVPTWHRFTQTHFCTLVSLSCPPTKQLAPQCQLTPCPSQFPQIWHVLCVGQHMDAIFPVSHILTPPLVYG